MNRTNQDGIVTLLRAELSYVQINLAELLGQPTATLEQYMAALTRLNSVRVIARDQLARRRQAARPPILDVIGAEAQRQRTEALQAAQRLRIALQASQERAAAQQRVNRQKRVAQPIVRALCAKKIDEPMGDACGICLETHKMRDGLHTSCGHCFGAECMKSYLAHPNSKNACPICRQPKPIRTTFRPRATPKKRAPKPEAPAAESEVPPTAEPEVPPATEPEIPEPQETPFVRAFLQRQVA